MAAAFGSSTLAAAFGSATLAAAFCSATMAAAFCSAAFCSAAFGSSAIYTFVILLTSDFSDLFICVLNTSGFKLPFSSKCSLRLFILLHSLCILSKICPIIYFVNIYYKIEN